MINFLKRQIQEIQHDKSLQIYGFFLSLTHIWSFLYWKRGDFFIYSQSDLNSEPLCFPFFPNCDVWRGLLSINQWSLVLWTYGLISLMVALLFLSQKKRNLAYWGFTLITLIKLSLHLSNYNFMGNYHYMIHCLSFLFLWAPHKKQIIKYFLVAFYVSAGLLKINLDWLSGAAMISPPWLSGKLLSFSLFYVVLLELVIVFGLLSSKKWLRWFTLFQLLAFHAISWHIVGFFYPMVMFSLLSLFFIDEYREFNGKIHIPSLGQNLMKGRAANSTFILLLLFWLLQALPYLITSDPSLSGAARLSSLNMFDAKTECHPLLVVHKETELIHIDRPLRSLGVRLNCDPLVYLNQAHKLCRQQQASSEFKKLSLSLFSKRVTDFEYTKVFDLQDVCSLSFPLWGEFAKGDDL